jgi:hypothetical protein
MDDAIEACISDGFFELNSTEQHFSVVPEKCHEIIDVLWAKRDKNHDDIIIALGEMMYHSYNVVNNTANYLQQISYVARDLLDYLPQYANVIESQQNHLKQRIDSDQHALWAILSGKAKAGSIAYWFDHRFHVYYKEGYWTCLYKLLLILSPSIFINTMKETNSPLMLAELIEHLAWHHKWDKELYTEILNAPWEWTAELSAQWLWTIHEAEPTSTTAILDTLTPISQLGQSAYLLSRAVFAARLPKPSSTQEQQNTAWDFCDLLIQRIALLCDNDDISLDDRKRMLKSAIDCEERCNCWIKLEIAGRVKNTIIRNFLLDWAIEILLVRMRREPLPYQGLADKKLVQFGAVATCLRYGEDVAELIWDKILLKSAFDDWNEPYLADRDYARWSCASRVVRWQLQFLYEFQKNGGAFDETMQKYWEMGNAQEWDIEWET